MFVNIPVFETLEKAKRYMESSTKYQLSIVCLIEDKIKHCILI